MKFCNKFILLIFLITSLQSAFAEELVIIGNIPKRFLRGVSKPYSLGYIHMNDRVIVGIGTIKSPSSFRSTQRKFSGKKIIYLKKGKIIYSKAYDYIYPGLIDLHNHTKQNNLDVWGLAKGQFKNRFEWRDWKSYKYSVSGNMNPWIGYGKPIECAAFRWSEVQAMVLGTTYLQGPSTCINNYAIHRVEDPNSYISNKERIQAPTDLVIPGDMTFVWQELRPLILKGKTYGEALADKINEHCDLPNITGTSVMEAATLKLLRDKKLLKESCKKGVLHKKFIRYVYWIHGTIAGKLNYLKKPNHAAVIAHLAEGRRDDAYNKVEFEIAKMLGFDQPHVNFVHGVGIPAKDLEHMGQKKMGLVWSVFSNLLLYGETLDIKKAKESGVLLSIGSDWLPTGSRGILEEAKIAANYVDKDPDKQGLKKIFTDEELFLMMTEYPAKMINHWDIDVMNNEHGIGQIAVGAMASLIAVRKHGEDPYTSLIRRAYAEDVNFVLIDGKPVYGNENYLNQFGLKADENYEKFPMYMSGFNNASDKNVSFLSGNGINQVSKMDHLTYLAKTVAGMNVETSDNCQFKIKKGFVHQNSFAENKSAKLDIFQQSTGLNMDRFYDLQKLIGISMMTQSRNLNNPEKGKLEFALSEFPSLFSCNSKGYSDRIFNFIDPKGDGDEFSENRDATVVEERRVQQKLGRVPEKLAEEYAP